MSEADATGSVVGTRSGRTRRRNRRAGRHAGRRGGRRAGPVVALAIAALTAAVGARAQDSPVQGPVPQAGAGRLAPAGWIVQAPDAARILLLGPDGVSSIVIVVEEGTLAGARERLSQPLALRDVGELTPIGQPTMGRDMVSNRFLAPGAGPAHRAGVLARRAPAGRLIVLYGFTQPGGEAGLDSAMLHLAGTVGAPGEPARAPGHAPAAPKPDMAQ